MAQARDIRPITRTYLGRTRSKSGTNQVHARLYARDYDLDRRGTATTAADALRKITSPLPPAEAEAEASLTPRQKRGRSRQCYRTPPEFIAAVMRDFAVRDFARDLAATRHNSVSPHAYLGPGSPWGRDSLLVDWIEIDGDLWLNSPFEDINPWVAKCEATLAGRADGSRRPGRIFQLTPAATGTNWYADHVDGRAHVVALRPRIQFVGCPDPYPKDLLLSVWGPVRGGFSTWKWK